MIKDVIIVDVIFEPLSFAYANPVEAYPNDNNIINPMNTYFAILPFVKFFKTLFILRIDISINVVILLINIIADKNLYSIYYIYHTNDLNNGANNISHP